jgi:hypothetical protein
MSGDSTHGVGAGFCALAGVANAVSASAAKTVLENFVICILPTTDPEIALRWRQPVLLNKPRTAFFRQYRGESGAFATLSFHDSSFAAIFALQSPLLFLETRPWGLPDEPAFESLLLDRIVGFGAGVRRVCE